MTLNPFLARELRARWRDRRAFVLTFAFVAALALLVGWQIGQSNWMNNSGSLLPHQKLATLGHELFVSLAWVQVLGWLLISPALTSSSIAHEREKGLLENLLLCPLSPLQIVFGKLGAALFYAAILLLATLPFYAITFLMGGVSPGEFWTAFALQCGTALAGASVGIVVSAWHHRGNSALRVSYVVMVGWIVGSGVAMFISLSGLRRFAPGQSYTFFWDLFLLFGQTNPIYAALEATSFGQMAPSGLESWKICLGFEALLCLSLPIFAARGIRKPLGEAQWIARQQKKGKKRDSSGFFDVPGIASLKFSNPVFARELRNKFRMRQPPMLAIIVEAFLGLGVFYFYIWALWTAWKEPMSRDVIWWIICVIALIVVMIACAVMGANGFARERESGTWEGVRLSLLEPAEILRGKIGGILLACALFSLPFWPLLLLCLRWDVWGVKNYGNSGVSLFQAGATLLILASTAWAFTVLGMWISWRHKKSAPASGWTLGALFGWLVIGPVFLVSSIRSGSEVWLALTHPVAALIMAAEENNRNDFTNQGWPLAVVMLFVGCFFYAMLKNDLADEKGME